MSYKKKVVPFNMKKTDNVAVILFFATFIVLGIINLVDKRTPLLATGSVWWDSLITLGTFVVGMFLHEGIHALSAIVFGKIKPSQIKFGIDLRSFNLYTHFAVPMPARAYSLSLILPCVITGVVPMAIVTAFGGPILLASACLLTAGCAGDLVMFFATLKCDKKAYILDHPTALAYYLAYPEGETPEGFEESTLEEEKAALEKSVGQPYYSEKGQKKNLLMKCLGILAFLALYVLAMYLISVIMKNM